ncbi:MAG: DUF2155 domain-containing protein [Rhizobiales bacterium]|nr:DUF2155 domain-containing protein [Hyphomicrobiales bacterium]
MDGGLCEAPGGGAPVRRLLLLLAAFLLAPANQAPAARLANPIAVFSGLDKITGLTTTFEIAIGDQKMFGGLVVKPDVCYTRPVTEEPKTTSFVEVDEIQSDKSRKRIFTGWMFAESPGLNAVEHPIYDVWLVGCRDPSAPPPVVETTPDTSTLQDQLDQSQPQD